MEERIKATCRVCSVVTEGYCNIPYNSRVISLCQECLGEVGGLVDYEKLTKMIESNGG